MEKNDKFQIPYAAIFLFGSAYAFHKFRDKMCRDDEKIEKKEEKEKKKEEKEIRKEKGTFKDEHAIAQKVWQDRIDRLYL